MSHIDDGNLHAYLDGELGEQKRELVAGHLAECGHCRARLEQAQALARRASALLAELEPTAAQAPPWHEIEERAAARARTAPRRRWVRPTLAWAATIVIAFGAGWLSRSFQPEWMSRPVASTRKAEAPSATAADVQPAAESEAHPAAPGAVGGEVSALRDAAADERTAVATRPAGATQLTEVQEIAPEGRGVVLTEPAAEAAGDREAGVVAGAAAAKRERAAEPLPAEQAPPTPVELVPALAPAESAAGRERPDEAAERPAAGIERGQAPAGALRALAEEPQVQVNADQVDRGPVIAISSDEAANWLGAPLRTLPDLELQRVEVAPGTAVPGGVAGLPAVRLIYSDAAGHEVTLIQQWLGGRALERDEDIGPALVVDPSGRRAYRWQDSRGYRMTLIGEVSGDSLRALAARVR